MFHVERAFKAAGLDPSPSFVAGAITHLELVYKWNAVHDLTAVPPEQAVERHTLDSILPFRGLTPVETVLDVGSGAGFPGVPLSLWWPNAKVTLLEPLRKRRSFLETVAARLDLNAVTRGEAVEKLQGLQFDMVTSRATLPWPVLLVSCAHVVKPGGVLLGLLGPEQAPADAQLPEYAGTWSSLETTRYALPNGVERVALRAVRAG